MSPADGTNGGARAGIDHPDDPGFEILLKANQVLGVLELLSEAVDSGAIDVDSMKVMSKRGFLGLLHGAIGSCEAIADLTEQVQQRPTSSTVTP